MKHISTGAKSIMAVTALFVLIVGGIILYNKTSNDMAGAEVSAVNEEQEYDRHVDGEAEMLEKVSRLQKNIDNVFMKNNQYVELYYEKTDGDGELIKVENFDDIKDKSEVKSTYNIVRYPDGNYQNITEMPNPDGKNFENIYNSIYDESGNLLKFQRVSRFMIEQVSMFVENSETFYDNEHEPYRRVYSIVDLMNSKADVPAATGRNSEGRIKYNIYKTTADFAKAHPVK